MALPMNTYDDLLEMNARLMAQLDAALQENEKLRQRTEELEKEVDRLKRKG